MLWSAGFEVEGVPNNENPARIINLSLGARGNCPLPMQQVINELNSKNIIIVVSSGNSAINIDEHAFFPASCDNVITVGATNVEGDRSNFSNYGDGVFYAPGGDQKKKIFSSFVNFENSRSSYGELMGTSMSAPHISAMIGHVLGKYENYNINGLKKLLEASSLNGIVSFDMMDSLANKFIGHGSTSFNSTLKSSPSGETKHDLEFVACGSIELESGPPNGGGSQLYSLLFGLILLLSFSNAVTKVRIFLH